MEAAVQILGFDSLSAAREELRRIGVFPEGVEIMAPKMIHLNIKIHQITPRAANIIKQEILSRGGDAAHAWTVAGFKPDKTDLLIMANLAQLQGLMKKLDRQPYFGIPELAALIRKATVEAVPDARPLFE